MKLIQKLATWTEKPRRSWTGDFSSTCNDDKKKVFNKEKSTDVLTGNQDIAVNNFQPSTSKMTCSSKDDQVRLGTDSTECE